MNTQLRQANLLLQSLVGEDNVTLWWNSPNKAFSGAAPAEIWKKNPDLVIDYLMGHSFGGEYY